MVMFYWRIKCHLGVAVWDITFQDAKTTLGKISSTKKYSIPSVYLVVAFLAVQCIFNKDLYFLHTGRYLVLTWAQIFINRFCIAALPIIDVQHPKSLPRNVSFVYPSSLFLCKLKCPHIFPKCLQSNTTVIENHWTQSPKEILTKEKTSESAGGWMILKIIQYN